MIKKIFFSESLLLYNGMSPTGYINIPEHELDNSRIIALEGNDWRYNANPLDYTTIRNNATVYFDRFEIYPDVNIYGINDVTFISEENKAVLQTDLGVIPRWQYTTDDPTTANPNWQNVPVSVMNKQTDNKLYITSTDLFGDQVNNYIGRMVYFRIQKTIQDEDNILYTGILSLEVKPSIPKVSKTTVTNALCNGYNGSITIEFERQLENGEKLQLFWQHENRVEINNSNLTATGNGTWMYKYENLPAANDILIVSGWNAEHQITAASQFIPLEIKQPDPLIYSTTSKKDVDCYNTKTGSITITANGGTMPYTLHWKEGNGAWQSQTLANGVSTHILSNLAAGLCSYYIIDNNGCEYKNSSGRVIIDETIGSPLSQLTISVNSTKDPTGFGLSNGNISFTISGGYGNYSVSYKYNGGTSQALTNTPYQIDGPAGSYEITVIDNNGNGVGCPTSRTVTLNQPSQLTASITVTRNISCFGENNGALSASASGGKLDTSASYQYEWYKLEGGVFQSIVGQGQYTSSISGLVAGTYRVKVTDSNDIFVEKDITLGQPALVEATQITSQNILCRGENTGFIQFKIEGGSGTYTVSYRQAGVNEDYLTRTVSGSGSFFRLDNLPAGVYQFKVQDSNNCEAPAINDITLTQPSTALEITQSTVFAAGIGRNDGRITVLYKGGVAPYTVEWKNNLGAGFTGENTVSGELQQTVLRNLVTGTYILNVKDANGCSVSQSFNVEERTPLEVNLLPENVKCYDTSTGKITARASGGLEKEGAMPYAYEWYKVESPLETLLTNETDSILSNIPIGKYKAVVKDSLNDVATSSIVEITQPPVLTATFTKQDIACFDGYTGYIHVTAAGGTGSYTLYHKLADETVYNSIQSLPGSTALNVDHLSTGTYNLYIEDSNECIASFSGQNAVTVELTQPEKALGVGSEEVIHLSGYKTQNGKITTLIEGGTPPYAIEWKNALNNSVSSTETDETTGVTTFISDLQAGDYTLTVTDANYTGTTNGCLFTKTYTLTQPDTLTVTPTLVHVLCNGFSTGSITAHVQGGVPGTTGSPYIYQWYTVNDTGQETLISEITGNVLDNLPAGKYKVKITDYSYLPNTAESDIVEITQPTPLVTSVSIRDISCFGGDDGYIRIQTSGGAGAYRFFYKLQEENVYNTLSINETDNTFYLEERIAGTYSIYILDGNDCYAPINDSDIALIQLEQPLKALQIVAKDSLNPSGYNRHDGQITLALEGGRPPYSVTWTDDKGNTFTENPLANIPEGIYSVEIHDSAYAGATPHTTATCMTSDVFHLVQPDSLMVTITETRSIQCYGESIGQLSVSVTGGVPKEQGVPYSYQWFRHDGNNFVELQGEITTVLDNRPVGLYRIRVTDFSRTPNITIADFQLNQPDLLTATATQKELNCGETTPVEVIVTGGTAPYSYDWVTGQTSSEIGNMLPGNYMVLITDNNGCQTTAWARISTPENIQIDGIVAEPDCYQGSNGSIKLNVNGGKPPYTYLWNYGNQTSKDLSGLSAGNYAVTVRDNAGCMFSTGFILFDPEQLTVNLGEDRTLCNGQSLTLIPTINQANVQYTWTGPDGFASTAPSVRVDKAGTYRITATNDKGCLATDEIYINVVDADISSEIIVANYVFVNDTVMIVNISQIEPVWQEWILPETDSLKIVETHDHYIKVIFYELGNYTFGLRSHVDSCYQEMWKTVTVVEQGYKEPDLSGESIIKEFMINPNPNNGKFTVKVELSKVSSVHLRLIGTSDGKVWDKRRLDGQDKYEEPYEMVLPAGIYVLLLETASGRTTMKMIII